MIMKKFMEFFRVGVPKPKYVAITYTDETQERLRVWAEEQGFDLTYKFGGSRISPDQFEFHTTVMYSESEHVIPNVIIPQIPDEVHVVGIDYFGEEKDIPVLKVDGDHLRRLRKGFEEMGMVDAWKGKWQPHISLSYARKDLPAMEFVDMPTFPLEYDEYKIEDVI